MMAKGRLRRGVYILPTLFTVGNLLCGFASIIYTSLGKLETAAILIVIAGVLDGLDGRIARMTGTTSEFGLEFDSLADMVSFGVAPAFLAFHWSPVSLGRLGWLFAFLYAVCAGMRLARFNLKSSSVSRKFFAGIPSPPAAGLIACIAFAFPSPPRDQWISVTMAAVVVGLSALMVSRIRYRSFKDLDLRNRRTYLYVLAIAAILAAIVSQPKWTLLVLAITYALSGPAASLWSLLRRLAAGTPMPSEAGSAGEEVVDEPSAH